MACTNDLVRNELRHDLFETVRFQGNTPECRVVRRTVASLLNGLIFLGARPSEFRGVSDAGLSLDELAEILPYLHDSTWYESALNILLES